jgi:TolA-binding protein
MNLEVNFVNNFRMKNGECQIAADAFLDVIKRYGDHAFAYYYLSKALGAMNRRKEAEAAMHTYHEIRENDDAWKEYANYFKLN